MPAPRTNIAISKERADQLKTLARLATLPVTEYLEEIISARAMEANIMPPGLIVATLDPDPIVIFGFKTSNDGEQIPITDLTPDEARELADSLEVIPERLRERVSPMITSVAGHEIELSKQSKALRMELTTPSGHCYKRTLSMSMAADVADWLRAAAAAAEKNLNSSLRKSELL
jgi:hypothetical protein